MKSVKRFVVQKHTKGLFVHWDLMFEAGGVLETYRLGISPEKLLRQPATAVRIFDHPLKFLTYEGSLSKGKGFVQIADKGTYQLLNQDQNRRRMQIDGKILSGEFTLTHIENDRWESYFLKAGTSGST
ncbi:MAG: DNA polymerase ligase N-terminal domain-containing protein [Planctomycetota bacterium]|jgi:bifunctional non-homologous end joining protein LigD